MSSALVRSNPEFTLALTSGDLNGYIQAANRIPVLSAEEERDLATRLHQDNDLNAVRRLVLAHLRFCRAHRPWLQRLRPARGRPHSGRQYWSHEGG